MSVTVIHGDMRDVLGKMIAEGKVVQSVVTDPPYGLGFMGKKWDASANVAFLHGTWRLCFELLPPGGHLLAFAGTRTYHRMAVAIEEAGFEMRDTIAWLYGSGFPKSLNVSKAIDRAAGAEREVVGVQSGRASGLHRGTIADYSPANPDSFIPPMTAPATDAARQWEGWGTALKPASEYVCVAQKPFENSQLLEMVGSTLKRLEHQLWSLLSANAALGHFKLSRSEFDEVSASAPWSAAERSNTRDALCAQMDMSQFELATLSSLNTVRSWRDCWTVASLLGNTSTTETASSTTIDPKIWKSCLSRITPASIIPAHRSGAWSSANAGTAERLLNADAQRLSAIHELSALANASDLAAILSPDEEGLKPNLELICVARKPLVGTVAANVLKHGTGAFNIAACRVPGIKPVMERTATIVKSRAMAGKSTGATGTGEMTDVGRWPANVCHDGSDEVVKAFPDGRSAGDYPSDTAGNGNLIYGDRPGQQGPLYADSGSAARFFYSAPFTDEDRQCQRGHQSRTDPASFVVECSNLQSEAAVSALSHAVAASMAGSTLQRQSYQAPSTSATASEFSALGEIVTTVILSLGQRFLCGLPLQNITVSMNLAKCAATHGPTGIMTITASHWKSDGSAAPVTFNITLPSLVRGARGSPGDRLFYSSKADADDRLGSKHPTIKPVDLMRWLVRLVTPPGGTVLDPFAGSGTTGMACMAEGIDCILVEREAEYVADIKGRIAHVHGEDTPLFRGVMP